VMYIFSNALFSPMKEAIILLICLVSSSCPALSHQPKPQPLVSLANSPSPTPGIPALFDATVKSFKSGRSRSALINELGTPENPNPPTSTVVLPFISLIASCAESQILLIALLAVEDENSCLELKAPPTSNREALISSEVLSITSQAQRCIYNHSK
jgi:hypothetical protein